MKHEPKHTPGPFGISKIAAPGYCPQFSIYPEQGSGRDIAIVKDAETPEETRANAALFHAAPDMLAALENALPWLIKADIDGAFNGCALPLGGRKAWEQMERAIIKAKGD